MLCKTVCRERGRWDRQLVFHVASTLVRRIITGSIALSSGAMPRDGRLRPSGLWFAITLAALLAPAIAQAGTTGKLSGTVTDEGTGQPLPGCNITIEGTPMGAASDAKGEFFVINIPPGVYVVRSSMMGYAPVRVSNVRIMTDLTTTVDFKLAQTVIQLAGEIAVVAERPMVQHDITSKIAVVESAELVNMPVDDFQGVLATKAGFTTDAEGNIHVRGGRVDEIAYLVDGMEVEDPLYGGFGSMINEDAIDEMVVLSGTFNAEYGDAMSSVVNIVTKEGGDVFGGKLEYTSPMLNDSPYRKSNPFPGVNDSYDYVERSVLDDMDFDPANLELPVLGVLNSSLSGPVPLLPKLSFFVSGRYENEDSYLPHGYSLQRDGLIKLTYRFSPAVKLSVSEQSTTRESQRYDHAWKYRSDHQNYTIESTDRLGLVWTHNVKPDMFYTLAFSRHAYRLQTKVLDKQPDDYERGQTGETVYFYVEGDDEDFADDETTTYAGKCDVTYQAGAHHQFKVGAAIQQHAIDVYEESEPWPSGLQFQDRYKRKPREFSLYAQDKIEYDYLILNAGLRYDYADPRAAMWPDVLRFGYWDDQNNWTPASEERVGAKTQVSPRIGLSHPVTDRAALYFSYGHFFQNPDYNALYYNSHKDLASTLPLVGNPRVKPQKTVTYETGLKYQLSDDLAVDLTAWYKDITDLLSTLHVSYLSRDYVVFYNSDYASVKGIDLTLRKRRGKFLSGSIDYTYMVAKGNNSQPLGGYVDAFTEEEIPHQEYFLDFDQRHDLSLNLDLTVPPGEGPELLGLTPFSDVTVNLLVQAGSGLPYTPYVDPTLRIEINSERKPWTSTVDLRTIKRFALAPFKPAAFIEITNLFDRENVVYVYSRTGKPFDTGLSGLVGSSPDADHNPRNVGPPRMVRAGVQVTW